MYHRIIDGPHQGKLATQVVALNDEFCWATVENARITIPKTWLIPLRWSSKDSRWKTDTKIIRIPAHLEPVITKFVYDLIEVENEIGIRGCTPSVTVEIPEPPDLAISTLESVTSNVQSSKLDCTHEKAHATLDGWRCPDCHKMFQRDPRDQK